MSNHRLHSEPAKTAGPVIRIFRSSRIDDMNQIAKAIHEVYDTRERYIIIGLTGRTGSGCTTAAKILATSRNELNLAMPEILSGNRNETRKFSITKRFINENWEPFIWIEIKNIITSFIVENEKEAFIDYIATYLEPENVEKRKEITDIFLKKVWNRIRDSKSRALRATKKD